MPPNLEPPEDKDYIKWVDLSVPYSVLDKAYRYDVDSADKEVSLKMTELLAYVTMKNGNSWSAKRDIAAMGGVVKKLTNGQSMESIAGDNKYYRHHLEVYETVFGEFLGRYESAAGTSGYGLIAAHPIAKGYNFSHYDDFGASRNYGYKRRHLGHDMFGSVGTPIMAIEGGIIAEIGWNRYGGWRIGIRSFDGKRYYYYAHLRKDSPFKQGLEKGSVVEAGQHIGYLGISGYSTVENRNIKTGKPHLHVGLQLIFHPSQESGSKEIWVDMYAITKLLERNRVKVG